MCVEIERDCSLFLSFSYSFSLTLYVYIYIYIYRDITEEPDLGQNCGLSRYGMKGFGLIFWVSKGGCSCSGQLEAPRGRSGALSRSQRRFWEPFSRPYPTFKAVPVHLRFFKDVRSEMLTFGNPEVSRESLNWLLAPSFGRFMCFCISTPSCGGQATPSWPF